MYLPKSKISPSKYSSGGQFVYKSDQSQHSGKYYETSDGKFFSGEGPYDETSKELISSIPVPSIEFFVPKYYYPTPTQEDYNIGFMVRYFLKRRNESFANIIEISFDDYQKSIVEQNNGSMDTSMYVSLKLNWKITGPLNNDFGDKNFPKAGIIETNQKLVKLKEKVFPGFSFFIKDYSQFAKPS